MHETIIIVYTRVTGDPVYRATSQIFTAKQLFHHVSRVTCEILLGETKLQ